MAKEKSEVNNEICDQRYCVSDTELVIYNEIGLMLGTLTNLNEREESGDKFFYCRTKRNAEEIKAYFSKLQPHNLSDPCFPLFIVIENDTDNDALNSVKDLLDNSFKYTILKLDKSKDGIAWFAPEENTYYNTTASLVGYGMVDCAESIYEVKTSKTFIEFQYGNHQILKLLKISLFE